MKTPAKIMEVARYLVDMYGDHVEYLGKYQGAEVFYYHFPDDITAGFCPVYLYKDGKVDELTGDIAYNFLDSFVENFDKVGIE